MVAVHAPRRLVAASIVPTVISLAVPSSPLFAQAERWHVDGYVEWRDFAASLASVQDLNGDGRAEFLVGMPASPLLPDRPGRALLFHSGKSAPHYEFVGTAGTDYGRSLASLGDIDGDAVGDLAIGAPLDGDGAVFLHSGADHSLLRVLRGSSPAGRFGSALAAVGDVDGDGAGDLAIGIPSHNSVMHLAAGRVELYSGASGALLSAWDGQARQAQLGDANLLAGGGDLDGDGVGDLLAIERNLGATTPYDRLRFFSGATFGQLRFVDTTIGSYAPSALAFAGDLDGDGGADAVWGRGAALGSANGELFAVRGADGSMMRRIAGERTVGRAVGAAGDVDGDGHDDLAFTGSVWFSSQSLHVVSGRDWSELAGASRTGTQLAVPADFDGDGALDLLLGTPPASHPDGSAGKATCLRASDGKVLRVESHGDLIDRHVGGVALLRDRDGDGEPELLAGTFDDGANRNGFVVLGGGDGRELARFAGDDNGLPAASAALPDLDGDGLDDIAVASSSSGLVKLHSGADGAVIRSFGPGRKNINFGAALVVAVEPNGAVRIAVSAPFDDTTKNDVGSLWIYDAASGNLDLTIQGATAGEQLGGAVAWLGDLNGDTIGDWAVGAAHHPKLGNDTGRVAFRSGKSGVQLAALFGNAAGERFGSSLAAGDDFDGDGLADLWIGAPGAASYAGELRMISSSTLLTLATITGSAPGDELGAGTLIALPDANGDGVADLATAPPLRGRVELYSGSNGAQLFRRDFAGASVALAKRMAVVPAWSGAPPRRAGPLLALDDDWRSDGGPNGGRHQLLEWDDLYLQLDPTHAPAGATVTASVRGGPAGRLAGLFLESIDGLPVGLFLALDLLDAEGNFTSSVVLPPGLAGSSWTLRGFAIGFDGKLADSQPQEFEFD